MSARKNVIPVRLDDDELAHLDRSAAEAGLPRATYARQILGGLSLGRPVVGKVESVTPGKARPEMIAGPVRVGRVGGADLAQFPTAPGRCPECGSRSSIHQKGCARK